METDESYTDNPPMSRLFIICGKSITEEIIKSEFSKFGNIRSIWLVKDKNTGENKGIAYVKFLKTSDAAAALEEMNGKTIAEDERPLKVFVASSRGSATSRKDNDERYLRLFIVVGKSVTKGEIIEEFSKHGEIDSVVIVKDKKTKESKGVAYVKYKKFIGAALAFENSPQKYKAIFATPRPTEEENYYNSRDQSPKRPRVDIDSRENIEHPINSISSLFKFKQKISNPTNLEVISSNLLNQDQLWRLFDVIPGLDYCQIVEGCGPKDQNVTVVYTNSESAQYAKEKLHGLEYPPGQRLIVRIPSKDFHDFKTFDSELSRDRFCSVRLQPPKQILDSDAYCAARCFIVLSSSIPIPILRDVFSTFGSLINVYMIHNKNCGYVKYGSAKSAETAIKTLNDAEICGVKIKVMVADEPKDSHTDFKDN